MAKKIETAESYLDWVRTESATNLILVTDLSQILWNGIRVKDLNNLLNYNWNALRVEVVKQSSSGMSIQELVIENVITHEQRHLQHIATHGHLDNLFRDAIEKFIKDEELKLKKAAKKSGKPIIVEFPKATIPSAPMPTPVEEPESKPTYPQDNDPIKEINQIKDVTKGKPIDSPMSETVARMEQIQYEATYKEIREKCAIIVEAVLELSEINMTKSQKADLALKALDMIERILGLGAENA